MSDNESISGRDARAQKAADKAHRKALRPWYKKKRFDIPLGIVLIAVLSNLGGGGDDKTTPTTAIKPAASSSTSAIASEPPAPAPTSKVSPAPVKTSVAPKADAAIGAAVRDKDFEFTANGVDCSQTQIGDQYLNTKAQGKFCIVDINVKNVGNDPKTFDASEVTMLNAAGQKFNANSGDAIYLGEAANTFLQQINPGNAVAGKVVFDVPVDMQPQTLLVKGSLFSGGKRINLV